MEFKVNGGKKELTGIKTEANGKREQPKWEKVMKVKVGSLRRLKKKNKTPDNPLAILTEKREEKKERKREKQD